MDTHDGVIGSEGGMLATSFRKDGRIVLLGASVFLAACLANPAALYPPDGQPVCEIPGETWIYSGVFVRVDAITTCRLWWRGHAIAVTRHRLVMGRGFESASGAIIVDTTEGVAADLTSDLGPLHLFARGASGDVTWRFVAHRGVSAVAPENTLPAMQLADRLGFGGIETDVRFTSDAVPVLLHDASVDRTSNGHGDIHRMTLAQARALDFGAWRDPRYAGTPIPTLAELAGWLNESRMDLAVLELKNPAPLTARQAVRVIASIVEGSVDRIVIASFVPENLRAVQLERPHLPTMLLSSDPLSDSLLSVLASVRPTYLGLDSRTMSPAQFETVQARVTDVGGGTLVMLFALHDPVRELEYAATSVAALISDRPWLRLEPRF